LNPGLPKMPSEANSLVSHFFAYARNHPDHSAFISGEISFTYGAAAERTAAITQGLSKRGISPGDRVALSAENQIDLALSYFAIHAIGAVAVMIDAKTPDNEKLMLVADCQARLLVAAKNDGEFDTPIATFDELTSEAARDLPEIRATPDSLSDLLYTTGTTGRPKGVLLSHANILSGARHINAVIQPGPDDTELVPIPLSHSFGLGRLRCMALTGNTLIIEPNLNNAAAILMRLLALRATGLALVPAGFEIMRRLTRDRIGEAAKTLRYIEIGSAPIHPDTKQWLMDLLPDTHIYHHYGMTEATRSVFTEYHRDKDKPGSVGLPSPGIKVKILDDDGRSAPLGTPGEIVVSGGMVMQGYWDQPELTKNSMGSEGFHSGDIGYLDSDGYLYLAGRKSDIINIGGYKVDPDGVESHLNQCPGITESMCVGVPDPDGITGEAVLAYIVSEKEISSKMIINSLRGKLEEYKIPKSFQSIDKIPKSSSGKIKRQVLSGGTKI